jgi:predicted XRE-type DNA-binding protein
MQKKIASKTRFAEIDAELQQLIKESVSVGETLKNLKDNNGTKEELDQNKKKMAELKKKIEDKGLEKQNEDPEKLHVNRPDFEEVMTRRFFYIPSFEIYGKEKILLKLFRWLCWFL